MIDKNEAVKLLKKRYKYVNDYQKENYKRVVLMLDKDTGSKLEKLKKDTGKSYTELLKPAIDKLILANTENNNNINN